MPDTPDNLNPDQVLNPDLAGYPNVDALVKGYRESGSEAKRLRDELQKRDELLAQFLTNGGASPNGRQSVPDRRQSSPEERLTEFGLPVSDMRDMVRGEVRAALEPISQGIQARGKVVSEHPDYIQFEVDVAHYINTDPELSVRYPKMFSADPEGAMEYAFLKFGETRRRAAGAPAGGTRESPADAAIPTSRAGDGRRGPDHDSAIREAFERFQKTGSSRDAAAYAKARLRNVISDEFLSQ
jgi:hypothetical protein